MSDTIYRQDAIDALYGFRCGTRAAWKVIEDLPPAQLDRKTGKWITVEGRLGDEVECNQCHSVFWYWMGNYRFCPACGADMRG